MQPVSFRRAAAASLLLLGLAQAEGAILVLEQFNYTAGGIAGLNGGTGFTGAFTGTGSVTAPGLQFPNLITVGNKFTTASSNGGAFRTINPIDTNSGTIWVSFLESTNGTVADYAGLSFFNGGTEELFLGKPSSTTNYGFDVSGVAGGANNSAAAPALATASFLLYRISFSSLGETVDFFANNSPGTTPTTPTISFAVPEGSFLSTFNTIRIQSGNQAANFDEVRIGTTYADVSPVPEPASVGVIGAGVLALAGVRRRKV
jgi:hypothetical protein